MRVNKSVLGVFLLWFTATGAAQDYAYRTEVFGSLGWGHFADSEGSLGNGANFGGGVGIRLSRRLGLEFDLSQARHARETSGGGLRFEGTGTYFTGNLIYRFSQSRLQPYLFFGAGVMHYDGSIRSREFLDPFDPSIFRDTITEGSGNGFAWNVGFGLKTFLTRNLSLRPEVRFFAGRPPFGPGIPEPPLMVARASLALGYHW
jgi:opacity protein-like surface antigen